MADVEALCERVLVIHHGRLLFDGALSALADRFESTKTITVQLRDDSLGADVDKAVGDAVERGLAVVGVERGGSGSVAVTVERADAPAAAALLLERLDVLDVSVEDPPLEDVIDRVFTGA